MRTIQILFPLVVLSGQALASTIQGSVLWPVVDRDLATIYRVGPFGSCIVELGDSIGTKGSDIPMCDDAASELFEELAFNFVPAAAYLPGTGYDGLAPGLLPGSATSGGNGTPARNTTGNSFPGFPTPGFITPSRPRTPTATPGTPPVVIPVANLPIVLFPTPGTPAVLSPKPGISPMPLLPAPPVTVVPVPSSILLLLGAIGGLLSFTRRRGAARLA